MTYKQYREQWDNAHRVTPKIPLNVDIELSSICNLKCPFCFISNPKHKQPKKFITLDMAIQIINEAHRIGVPALKLNWRGESTLHPDFIRIAEYAATFNFHDRLINTNGNYGPESIDGLMACTKVMFSLDSCNPETYKKIRIGGDLLKVLMNIHDLIRAGHKNIWVRRVISKDNKHEDFKKDVKYLFGNDVKVSEHYCFDRVGKQETPSKRLYCGYPSQRVVVSTDGNIYPCCVDYDCTMPIGKAPDLLKSFKSSNACIIRAFLKNGISVSDTCKNCTSWMGYDSPKRDKVKDIAL